ncbi:hypothetical protein [Bacillus pumilus]
MVRYGECEQTFRRQIYDTLYICLYLSHK